MTQPLDWVRFQTLAGDREGLRDLIAFYIEYVSERLEALRSAVDAGAVAAAAFTDAESAHVSIRDFLNKQLREDLRTAFVPVLMLTMNNDEATRTKGFLAGTDDFMAKPFSVPELVARVRRLLRRTYGVG